MPRPADLNDAASRRLIEVAAGILRDSEGRVLITERLGDTPFAGLWEFPGGKIHDGESAATALCRELEEEIGVVALRLRPFLCLEHEYPDRRVAIEFFLVEAWRNTPAGRDGQALDWCFPERIEPGRLLPADGPVLDALRANSDS